MLSPLHRFYCVGLLPPQAVDSTARRLCQSHAMTGEIPAPLAPMIPVQYFAAVPSPPVQGLLPLCLHPVIPGNSLKLTPDGRWVFWPVYAGDWFPALQEALAGKTQKGLPGGLFPLGEGIPIGAIETGGTLVKGRLEEPIPKHNWRRLNLVCYGISFIPGRKWFLSLHWQMQWSRRLRRAPANDGEQDALHSAKRLERASLPGYHEEPS